MATTDERVASQFDTAISNAHGALQTVQQSLVGAGPEAHAALKALSDRAVMLQGIASTARDYIDRLRADESQPREYRDRMAAEIHQAAQDRLRTERDTLVKNLLPNLENLLGENSLPSPNKDSGERMLRRQELDRALSGVTGAGLTQRMTELIGRNPEHDREMLSDWGRALMDQAGVGNDWPVFRKGAIGKLLSSRVGTEKQLANRKALATLYETKLAGRVDGLAAIAKSNLGDL